jgi:hypothetical protein
MSKPFTAVFFFLFLVFVGYVVLGATPMARIDRVCEPVSWVGRFTSSVVAVIHPPGETGVVNGFASGTQSCRFIVWRQIYSDEYQQMLVRMAAEEAERAKAKTQGKAPPQKDANAAQQKQSGSAK